MNALSTFIKLYILSCIVFLIPAAGSISSNNEKIVRNTHMDIDVKYYFPASSDSEFKTALVNKNVADLEHEIDYFQFSSKPEENISQIKPNFWTTLHSIESKQGRLLYRPSNKNRNCASTTAPCGHHQLSVQALKDISCSSKQCMSDRENFKKSLEMSKQLQAINKKRLRKAGYSHLPEYQEYLIHQQGATGLKIILAASKGNKLLSKTIKRNMAGNSPYSYKKLKRFGSKLAAKKFLQHWERKWNNEKKLLLALRTPNEKIEAAIKPDLKTYLPQFNNYELHIALNLKI